MKKKLLYFIKISFQLGSIGIITLFLFEFCYRYYIIDFYKFSWDALNSEESRKKSPVDLLVFGDSFSAKNNGYVSKLSKLFPEKIILNASSSGIGPKQVNLFITKRINQVKPKAILYQVYVGNDLLDVKNLSNWSKLSFTRNAYWSLSDYFISLRYLNQRLVVLRKDESLRSLGLDKPFSPILYDKRTKLCIDADEKYLFKTATLTEDFIQRYTIWKEALEVFLKKIPTDTKVYLVFIPHCAQVNDFYFKNMTQLGADFPYINYCTDTSYSFFEKAITDFKTHTNVVFLNPLQFIKERDKEDYRLYYENDPHFSENGDRELAEYLGKSLFIR